MKNQVHNTAVTRTNNQAVKIKQLTSVFCIHHQVTLDFFKCCPSYRTLLAYLLNSRRGVV